MKSSRNGLIYNYSENIMENNFIYTATKCHADRVAQYQNDKSDFNNIILKEYNLFCVWCKAYKNGVVSKQNFDEYSQKEREITPWVKNKLAEMYL